MPEHVMNVLIDETVCPPECLDFINCVFCKKSLTRQPADILGSRLLICCHSICSACAESWKEGTKTCPDCHCILPNDLLENKILQEFVEEPLPEAFLDGVCFEHKNIKTTKWCNDCSTLVCDSCIENHKALMVIRSHTIIDVKDSVPTSNKSLATFQCHQHPDCKLDMHCEKCDHITCRDCQLEHHKFHPYEFLSESKAGFAFRKDLLHKRCRLQHVEETLVFSKQAIEGHKVDMLQQKVDGRKKIDDLLKKIVESVEARFEELKNQLDSKVDEEIDELDVILKETESLMGPLKHYINIFNLIVNNSSDVALLYSKKHLEKCFEQVLRKDVKVYDPDMKKEINFDPGDNVDQLFEKLRTLGKFQSEDKCYGPRDVYDDLLAEINTVSAPTQARIQLRQDLQHPSPETHIPTEWSPVDTSSTLQSSSNMPHWHTPQEPPASELATIVPVPVVSTSTVPDPAANSSFEAPLAEITALTLSQEIIHISQVYTTTAASQSVPTTMQFAMPAQSFPQRVTAAAQSLENRHHVIGRQNPHLRTTPRPVRSQAQARPQLRSPTQGHAWPQGQRQVRPQGEAQARPPNQQSFPMSIPPSPSYSYRPTAPHCSYSTASATTQYPRNSYPAALLNNSGISVPSMPFQLAHPQQQTQHQIPQHPQILSQDLSSLDDLIPYVPGSTHNPYSHPG